jgi:hypothetical protein
MANTCPTGISAPAPCCVPRSLAGGFQGNKLGFQIPPTPPKCGGSAFSVKLPASIHKPCFPCAPPSTVAYPLSYESETLQPYQTFMTDEILWVNTIKTIPHAGYLFTLAITSDGISCISRVQAADINGLTRQTVALRSENPSDPTTTLDLKFGTGMVAMGKFLFICGTNAIPMIAKVNVDTLDVLVSAGNGELAADVFAEEYYNITTGFCVPGISSEPLLAVCGYIRTDMGADFYPSFRLIDTTTLLPVGIFGTGLTYSINIDKPNSLACSLCANPALGVFNILVSSDGSVIQTSIWTVSKDGTNLMSVLQYNDPTTGNLRLPGGVSGEYSAEIACLENGTVFALVRGIVDSTTAGLPSEVVVLYEFTPDTAPAMGFGVSGIVVWWDRPVGASYASSLLLSACDGQVFVVGNSLPPSPTTPDVIIYYGGNYNFPISTSATNLDFIPFVIKVSAVDGCTGLVLHGLPNCPCSDFQFAVDLCSARAGVLYVSGMVGKNIFTTPAIVSGLLTLFLSVHTSPARIVNCSPVAVNILNGYCNGIVGINNPCAPSTALQVQGPIVVGNSQDPPLIPGTIRFENGSLLVWSDSEWKTLAFAT